MNTLRFLSRMPAFALFRLFGRPRLRPFNLTLSFSFRCNSRCKTCHIHRKTTPELGLDEWRRVFAHYGRNIFWATISGGEPFLRKDLAALVCSLYDFCRPSIITIPTNGFMTETIAGAVSEIAGHCRRSHIIINVSLDAVGERHDEIRGLPGSYARALETFHRLKAMSAPNLSVGIHSVISAFNAGQMPEITARLTALGPDSYIAEIAEERNELDTIGSDITPDRESYRRAADSVMRRQAALPSRRIGRLTRAFRREYYAVVEKVLQTRTQVLPCYCGYATAHLAPNGDVWMCCVIAEPAGNLRESGGRFLPVWRSPKAEALRRPIRAGRCFCPLANAAYVNLLFSPRSMARIGIHLLKDALWPFS